MRGRGALPWCPFGILGLIIVRQRFLSKEPEMTPRPSPPPATTPEPQFPEALIALVSLLARETAREEFAARCNAARREN